MQGSALHQSAVEPAVGNKIFVGVSCNVKEPKYNCYPMNPPSGKHYRELFDRAERTIENVLNTPGGDDAKI